MPTKRDYYEVLGVDRGASADEIKRSFRRLARECHPDVNQQDGAEEKFKELNEAYGVLSDPQKRQMYDQFGHEGMNGHYSNSGFDGFGDFGGFGDIFDVFFGGGARGRQRTVGENGADLRYDLEITLEDAATGVEKNVRISRMHSCETCGGSGSKPGSSPTRCTQCSGSGQVGTRLGPFSTYTTCPACRGEGVVITDPCNDCSGTGRRRITTEQKLEVPAGVENGMRIRLRGQGDAGARGGAPGDLYVVVFIKPHKVFERHGDDIVCEIPINFVQATLGDTIKVPTLDGEEELHIPAGTQTGTSFKIPRKGIPNLNTAVRGNEHVVVRIFTPSKLNDEQKRLLLEFAKSMGVELNPSEGKGFFEKLLGK